VRTYHVVYEGTGGSAVALIVSAESLQLAILAVLARNPWLTPEMLLACVSIDDAVNVAHATLDKSAIRGLGMLML